MSYHPRETQLLVPTRQEETARRHGHALVWWSPPCSLPRDFADSSANRVEDSGCVFLQWLSLGDFLASLLDSFADCISCIPSGHRDQSIPFSFAAAFHILKMLRLPSAFPSDILLKETLNSEIRLKVRSMLGHGSCLFQSLHPVGGKDTFRQNWRCWKSGDILQKLCW